MANRFPLIVNANTKKIEELSSSDNLDLTSNNIIADSSSGTAGQYLKTDGFKVVWDNPGDVYLTASQTLSNKTFNSCIISGATNNIFNVPNSSLVNSSITVNNVAIPLGGSVTTPDNNTTYSVSAQDGGTATQKIIRLTSGGNANAGINDDVILEAGANVTLGRTGDTITITSSYIDTNTVTRLAANNLPGANASLVSGDITLNQGGSTTITQSPTDPSQFTISSSYVDTITKLRVGNSATAQPGDFTFLAAAGGPLSIADDGNKNFTFSTVDTITRLKGGNVAPNSAFVSGDVTILGGGDTVVSQSGNTITVTTIDDDTITRLRATAQGTFVSQDITFTYGGATTITQNPLNQNEFLFSSVDNNTTFTPLSGGGLAISGTAAVGAPNGTEFSLKNSANLANNTVMKWDDTNNQLTNSAIVDNGTTVTITGNLVVSGTTTTVDTTTLVVADNEIELRKGNNLTGSNGGIRLNRTTDGSGAVTSFASLQWLETGGYWRVYDGSVGDRIVTQNAIQTLTNKTLTSPILTTPTLGAATATSVNGLAITTVAGGTTLTIGSGKTVSISNTLTLTGTDGTSINFSAGHAAGARVAYTSDGLGVFASTTSSQFGFLISDSVGTGFLVFNTNPTFVTSVLTTSTTFNVFNTNATTINAFGAATTLNLGNSAGTTTIAGNLAVNGNTTIGNANTDQLTVNSLVDIANHDIKIRGTSAAPMTVGRGGSAVLSNTALGYAALQVVTSGSQNTGIGYEAGLFLTSGAESTAVGYRALRRTDSGTQNTAIGRHALLNNITGSRNTAVGDAALNETTAGDANVCVGHYAGFNCLGTGNVLIGPSDDENSTNATYQPPTISGNRQLVIGSGTGTWIRGDSNFDVTAPQNFNIGGNIQASGTLQIDGVSTTLNTATLEVSGKEITLGDITARIFSATVQNASDTITGVTPVTGLIPGMDVTINTVNVGVPPGTTITSISGNTIVLSNNVTGNSGQAEFLAAVAGPSESTANNGGLRVKAGTDKTFLYNSTDIAWNSSENINIAAAKDYMLGGTIVIDGGALKIGPDTGSGWSLGSAVTGSSLTSVGTLTSLTVTGAIAANGGINLGDNDKAQFGDGNELQIYHDGNSWVSNTDATSNLFITSALGLQLRVNSSEAALAAIANAQVELFYNNSKKFETTDIGAQVTGQLVVDGPANPADYTLSDGIFVQPANGLSGLTITSGSATNNAYINFSAGTASNAEQFAFAIGRDGTNSQGAVLVSDSVVARFGGNSALHVIGNHVSGHSGMKIQRTDTNISSLGFYSNSAVREAVIYTNPSNALVHEAVGSIVMAPANGTTAGTFGANGLSFPSGKGIDFSANANASGMTSELFDHYEEGTWTPTLTNTGGTPTYQYQQGRYTKIGRYVIAQGIIGVSNNNSFTTANNVSISLPFTASANLTYGQCGPVADGTGFGNITRQFGTMVGSNNTSGVIVEIGTNARSIPYGDLANLWYLRFNFMYEAA